MRRTRRWLAVLLLLALILFLPLLVNLEIFRQQVRRALEVELGREVELASLTARLLPRPGVVARGVMVFEQEGFGAEPFLYADEMHCDVPLRALWRGRLDCAAIHFLRPSINLVRNSDHVWNVGSLLLRAGQPPGEGTAGAVPPVISAVEGRINLKLGADKQVYALTAARLRVEPVSDGLWRLQLEATPMRSDRRLTETGKLRVQGEIGPAAEFSLLPFSFHASLERGSLAQLTALASGREPPLRAQVSFAASLEGRPAGWRAQGTVSFAQLRHRDLVASPGSPRWEGEFDLTVADGGRAVGIRKIILRGQRSELELTGRLEDAFGRQRWAVEVQDGRLALDELMRQWASLKENVASNTRLDGVARLTLKANGPLRDWRGELTAPEGISLQVPGLSSPVEIPDLRLRLERGRLELAPLTLQFSPEQALVLNADWRLLVPRRPYWLRWQSRGVDLESLQKTAAVFGWDLFELARWQGRAALELEWRGDTSAGTRLRWQGEAELREARFYPPEFNQPLEILQARLQWRGNRTEVQPLVMRLGGSPVTATLERTGSPGRWNASFSAGELRLGALDGLLNPARRGLLARLVGPESRSSSRWRDVMVAGDIRVAELAAGPFRLRQVQAQGRWEGGQLELTRLRFRAYGGRFDGRVQGDFRSAPPEFRLAGNAKQVELPALLGDTTELGPLFSGVAGADLSLQTAGTGTRELLRALQGRVVGVVHSSGVRHLNLLAAMAAAAEQEAGAVPDKAGTELQSLAGAFRVADEQVELDGVRMIVDGAALELSGRVKFDSSLELRLSGEPLLVAGRPAAPSLVRLLRSSYRVTGTLRRPQVELGESGSPAAGAPRQ